jgi:site-specific DNA-methyltransferase (adenine-specific)
MGYHYRARYENILFFEKGKRKLNNLSIPDIIECPRIFRGYPTEKPVDVSKVLIEQSTTNGELIADPFFGSCSIGVAAFEMGRTFIGNDVSDDAHKIACERISEHLNVPEKTPNDSVELDTDTLQQLSLALA